MTYSEDIQRVKSDDLTDYYQARIKALETRVKELENQIRQQDEKK
jgi:hypothetical protein